MCTDTMIVCLEAALVITSSNILVVSAQQPTVVTRAKSPSLRREAQSFVDGLEDLHTASSPDQICRVTTSSLMRQSPHHLITHARHDPTKTTLLENQSPPYPTCAESDVAVVRREAKWWSRNRAYGSRLGWV